MRNTLTTILFIFFISNIFFYCKSTNKPFKKSQDIYSSHLGKWFGESDGNNTINLVLKKNGTASLLLNEEKINIDKETRKDYKTIYAINYNSWPYELDIIFITKKKNGVNRVIRCIFDYMTDNVMKLSTYLSPIRPLKFEKEYTYYLRKETK